MSAWSHINQQFDVIFHTSRPQPFGVVINIPKSDVFDSLQQ